MAYVVIVCLLVAIVVAVIAAVQATKKKTAAQDVADRLALLSAAEGAEPMVADEGVALQLPPPVLKYLDLATPDDERGIRAVTLRQRGLMRFERGDKGTPFEAEHTITVSPAGYLWLAHTTAVPPVAVREQWINGRGSMQSRIAGAISFDDPAEGAEIDQAAALRFWSEVVTFPELVTHPHLEWQKGSDERARLFARHGDELLDIVVAFGSNGFPQSFHANRFREVDGSRAMVPWSALYKDWEIVDGRLYPRRWHSVWHFPDGDFVEVEAEVTSLRIQ